MKPLRLRFSLRTLLVFSALFPNIQAQNSTTASPASTTTTAPDTTGTSASTSNATLGSTTTTAAPVGSGMTTTAPTTTTTASTTVPAPPTTMTIAATTTITAQPTTTIRAPGNVVNLTVTEITTTSVNVSWTKTDDTSFRVSWTNGGNPTTVTVNMMKITDLTPGVQYNITVKAVASDNVTEGMPATKTVYTKPEVVQNLTVTEITTVSMSLNWTKPLGNSSFYKVEWNDGNQSWNLTKTETFMNITNLIPGVEYAVKVTAVAGDSHTEGASVFVSRYTRPVKPVNLTVGSRSTGSLSINWMLPGGRVDSYVVNISNANMNYFNSTKTTNTTATFSGLFPGRVFVITVTAVAGNFTETSDPFSVATYPTPPGSLTFSNRTNSSLQLKWSTPENMNGAPNISYLISYKPPDNITVKDSLEIKLDGLESGTLYSINITTVGPDGLRSTTVNNSTYTLPNPVQNPNAFPNSTTSIWVNWSEPLGVQTNYMYLVQTYNSSGALVDTANVTSNGYKVSGLQPGSNYSISISTVVGLDTRSTPVTVSINTMPKAVTNLTSSFVNTTSIQLTWARQTDYKSSYSYVVEALLGSERIQKNSTKEETFTFNYLIPGTPYTFNVYTVQGGIQSTLASIQEYTVPAMVSALSAIGTTNSLSVSWTKADGRVSSYVVQLKGSVENTTELYNETTQIVFTNLKPGVLYRVEVVTKSGPKQSNTSSVSNATFPSPPGSIQVDFQTNSSINFTWSCPADMDPHQYNFSVSTGNGSISTQNNWFLLNNLDSGRSYIISVVTVGALGYGSTPQTTQNYTRPNPVTYLKQTEITPSSVTLTWNQSNSKPPYVYEVQVKSVASNMLRLVINTNETMTTVVGLESGSNYTFAVTTLTADNTRAESVSVSYFTRPYNITNLNVLTLNTTAVYLNWSKPYEYKPDFEYLLETTGCNNQTSNSTVENTTFSSLTPGTNCSFCVTVKAANGIKGEAICKTQYTKPEVVQPSISSEGSNNSVRVAWTKPAGNVEEYRVQLNSTTGFFTEKSLGFTDTFFLFENLSAAVIYSIVVISRSGPFSESSKTVQNATFPNPPGQIEILSKTNSSVVLRWGKAPLMDSATNYSYRLIYNLPQQYVTVYPANTTYTLSQLLSGTPYNIYVKTVGPMDFESAPVIYKVTTRPNNVASLTTNSMEKAIFVSWNQPAEYKSTYSFFVAWQSSDGGNTQNVTKGTQYNLTGLTSGTSYNISVTTKTSDGTESGTETVSSCTDASPVTDLSCEGPNSGDAEIILKWSGPDGKNSGFNITVSNGSYSFTQNGTGSAQTISHLSYKSNYNVTVVTRSCGKPSSPTLKTCFTGVSTPPIAPQFYTLQLETSVSHNAFTVQLPPSLIDDSRGPVTHLGIVVTSDDYANNSNIGQYLIKTYDDWKLKSAKAYLATVVGYAQTSRSTPASFVLEVGNRSQWEGYTNGYLNPSGTYKYAIVIFTYLTTVSGKIDNVASVYSITNFSVVITLNPDPVVTSIAIGVTLGIFGFLFVIIIGFVIYWRRISRKESPDIQIQSLGGKVSVAVRVEDYEAYYRKQKADSSCGFAEEFEDLKPVGTAQAKLHALALENKPKNRYNNVLPYDSSRVKLSVVHGGPNEDYINANYMPGYLSRKEFIAAQGPLPVTVNEFWRMIWEKNVQTLVMLTRCNEQGRVKCEQYWGPHTKHCGDIIVTTTSEIPLEDWTIRDFDIKNVKTTEVRSVRHFHFTAWPDHGVPETTELLISFRHLVREHMNQYSRNSPTVVHCSAGVGRTGTFIAIDRLIFQIERENVVDVYGIVHDLRMHRPLMVQTEDQYVFLNQCALDIIRARTGNNVDLIYQNTAAISIYENVEPKRK